MTKYLTLDYRSQFCNELYDDVDLPLTDKDKAIIEDEKQHLLSLGFKIVHEEKDYGTITIEGDIEPQYLSLQPDYHESSKKGWICEFCMPECDQYNICVVRDS